MCIGYDNVETMMKEKQLGRGGTLRKIEHGSSIFSESRNCVTQI